MKPKRPFTFLPAERCSSWPRWRSPAAAAGALERVVRRRRRPRAERPRRSACPTTGLGNILVDSQGRTLYLFTRDSGTMSECSGACAVNWPPLRATGKPTIGSGADASLVSTTSRSGGAKQVTYNGHPLYLFKGDKSPGDTNGQGLNAFGGSWYALSPAGDQISGQPSSSGGGNGY